MFLGSGGRNESKGHQLVPKSEMKTFHELDVHHVQKVGIKPFLGSKGRIESNSHQLVQTSQMKTFHELDVHYVQKVGIKRFWAHEAEMSLTATSVFQQAR